MKQKKQTNKKEWKFLLIGGERHAHEGESRQKNKECLVQADLSLRFPKEGNAISAVSRETRPDVRLLHSFTFLLRPGALEKKSNV